MKKQVTILENMEMDYKSYVYRDMLEKAEMLTDRYGKVKMVLTNGEILIGKSLERRPWFEENGSYKYDAICFVTEGMKEYILRNFEIVDCMEP